MQNDAERLVGGDQPSMSDYMNQGLSMVGNIASKTKNVLGGVATQVANSMPAPEQMNMSRAMPQQYKSPQRQEFNR